MTGPAARSISRNRPKLETMRCNINCQIYIVRIFCKSYLSEELSPLVLPMGPRGVEDDVGDFGIRHLRRRLRGRHLDDVTAMFLSIYLFGSLRVLPCLHLWAEDLPLDVFDSCNGFHGPKSSTRLNFTGIFAGV